VNGNGRTKIVIAGGGTGGHVLPAIAVHEELSRREEAFEFLWIGSHTGVERTEAARAGIPFQSIQTGKLRRYFDLKTVTDAARLPIGVVQSFQRLRAFRPDVVFSTGGFVSVPTVVAARAVAPVVTHEQTAIIGLANKINARFATSFAVSYDSTARSANQLHRHIVVTGNPVRTGLRGGDATAARGAFGFPPDLPVIYITGGSRGASAINQIVFEILPKLLERACVVHQTGSRDANPDYDRAVAVHTSLPDHLRNRYSPHEFIGPELSGVYAMSSLVIGRAGAGTIAELAYVGLPSILIPLPLSGGGEQERNAGVLATAGAAVVIPQPSATPARILQEITQLLDRPDRLAEMAANGRSISRENAAAALAELILENARRKR
jgi:UDP-N-acetylglucosamine--N-acetylmuramyl-(pentapeptide) pyrophosphoryl-undecaprenol N-acetylglucosamine transferase